jgi:hypothetical protein
VKTFLALAGVFAFMWLVAVLVAEAITALFFDDDKDK